MFAPKHLGLTLLLSSILAACSTAPKKVPETPDTTNAAIAPTEANELDLEKIAKERAAQGQSKSKDENKEKNAVSADSSQEPAQIDVSAELKQLAAPVLADYQQAIVLMKSLQFDEAFARFDDIQSKAPMFAGPVINQALIRVQQQNYKDADLLLKKAAGLNDKNPFIYNLQGYVARQQGQFANARAAYEKAITISPKYAKAHFNLGILADLYLQDLPLALQHYEAYQTLQTTADSTVAKWVIDLQKRTGVYKAPAKPAKVEEIIVEETPAPVVEAAPSTTQAIVATPETTPPATSLDANVASPTTAPILEATPTPESAKPSDTPKNNQEKAKKSPKSKKQGKNVTLSTATPTEEPVKSIPAKSQPVLNSEPIPTTAAGVQP